MSSFICNDKHFAYIAKGIIYLATKTDFYFSPELLKIAPELDRHKSTGKKDAQHRIDALTNNLRDLQVLCVCLQYKHHFPGTLDQEIQAHKQHLDYQQFTVEGLTLVRLYKALCCALYQIETHHLEELRPLTTDEREGLSFFTTLKIELSEYIIWKSPAFQNAPWEIK